MVDRAAIRKALHGRLVEASPFSPTPDRAGVALMLAGPADDLSLAFILRVAHPKDPWSAHVAFPGGRASQADASARHTAERETLEEVGVRLEAAHFLAPLEEFPITRVQPGLLLSPFVYDLGDELAAMTPNQEVERAFWAPLRQLAAPENQTIKHFEHGGQFHHFPAVQHDGLLIWGITWHILSTFLGHVGQPLPPVEPPA